VSLNQSHPCQRFRPSARPRFRRWVASLPWNSLNFNRGSYTIAKTPTNRLEVQGSHFSHSREGGSLSSGCPLHAGFHLRRICQTCHHDAHRRQSRRRRLAPRLSILSGDLVHHSRDEGFPSRRGGVDRLVSCRRSLIYGALNRVGTSGQIHETI
jgi:hypothetical protein